MKKDGAFLRLYRKTPVIMHSVNREGKIVEVSDHWLRVMGYTRAEVIGRDPLEFLDETSREISTKINFPTFWKEGHLEKSLLTFVKKSGELIDVELTVEMVRDENNEPWRSLSVLTDVTKRNRATRKLSRANKELAAINEELERFAFQASNDLQEPLRKIDAACTLIHEKLDGQLDANSIDYLNMASLSISSMRLLIDDVLRFARLGSSSLNLKMTDMAVPLNEALSSLEQSIQASPAKIEINALPTIPVDGGFIRQMFQNLVGNSLKYRNQDHVRIVIDAVEEPDAWIVRVADNGIGVPLEHAEQIFDTFQRLHSRSEYPGTGIGLATCKRIVERHDGRIWLDSEYQGGCRFCVKFLKNPVKTDMQRKACGDYSFYNRAS